MLSDVLYAAIVAACAFVTGYRFGRHSNRKYVYGMCGMGIGTHSRKRRDGVVEFIMWRAGEHGHEQDFWYPFDKAWWPTFKEYDNA